MDVKIIMIKAKLANNDTYAMTLSGFEYLVSFFNSFYDKFVSELEIELCARTKTRIIV